MFCNQCGATVPQGAKFCEECGASLGNAGLRPTPGHLQSSRRRVWPWLLIGGGGVLLVVGVLFFAFKGKEITHKKKESSGLFSVVQDGRYGYINKAGKIVINPQFDLALGFSEGLAPMKIGDKLGYIDKMGKIVINPQFDFSYLRGVSFSEGLAAVGIGNKWGYIDKTGKLVINPQFDEAEGFSEGLAQVKIGDKWGYIDKTGKFVINLQFDLTLGFSEGLAAVGIGNKWGYIDKTGKFVINLQFDMASDFSPEGLAAVKIGDKWGYIDKTGKLVINPQFDMASDFSPEGLAAVKIGDKWGYIDKTGKLVINPQFDMASDFSPEGLAAVKIGDKWGYIDKTGKYVWNPTGGTRGVPNEVRSLVFETGEFVEPINLDPGPQDNRKDYERWRANPVDQHMFSILPSTTYESHDKRLLSFLVQNGYSEVQRLQVRNRYESRNLIYVFHTPKASQLQTVAKRALESITYTNQYEAEPSIKFFALTFTYTLRTLLPEFPKVRQRFEGKARAYLDPNDGRWKLETITLADEGSREYLQLIQSQYKAGELRSQDK